MEIFKLKSLKSFIYGINEILTKNSNKKGFTLNFLPFYQIMKYFPTCI